MPVVAGIVVFGEVLNCCGGCVFLPTQKAPTATAVKRISPKIASLYQFCGWGIFGCD